VRKVRVRERAACAARTIGAIAIAALAAAFATSSAQSFVLYDATLEWNGPFFRVKSAPLLDQLVDTPAFDIPFVEPSAVAAREHPADGRDVVYVADTGHDRVQLFETNAVHRRVASSALTYVGAGASAASQWDEDQIHPPEYAAVASRFLTPYSERVRIGGEPWTRVADLTGFTASDRVYRIDYGEASNAPVFRFPAGSLSATKVFALEYLVSDEQTGATSALGIGDVDYGVGFGASPVLAEIGEGSGGPNSWQEVRSLVLIANEVTSTSDDLFLLDSADNSGAQNEELFQFTVSQSGSVTYVEGYDAVLTAPEDVAVARSGASSPAAVALESDLGPFDQSSAAVIDASQVTGHSYRVTVNGLDVTIVDQATGATLVEAAPFADLANPFRGIPGLSLPKNGAVGADATITTTKAISNRFLFVADTGADRIKVIAAGDGAVSDWPGDWLPGDAHTTAEQPSGLGSVGASADVDYRPTTPSTVPEDFVVFTAAAPLREGTIATITFDPDGTPETWALTADLDTAEPTDRVYEVDWMSGRILFGDGEHGEIPPADTAFQYIYVTAPDVLHYGSSGTAAGQFDSPRGIAARWNASLGHFDLYLADTGNDRIQKFAFHPPDAALYLPARIDFVTQWSVASLPTDLLSAPADVVVSADGASPAAIYVAVADQGNDRIVLYRDLAGASGGGAAAPVFQNTLGSAGTSLGEFQEISGLAFLANGADLDLFAADATRGVVTKHQEQSATTLALQFVGASALPACYPPTGAYTFSFAVSNPPDSGWIDFYWSASPAFDPATAKLCLPSGSIAATAAAANWKFADSPGGAPTDGAQCYLYARMSDANGIVVAIDQSSAEQLLCIDADIQPSLGAADAVDGDRTLSFQNALERTFLLQVAHPESVVAAGITASFDPELIEVLSITRGDAWLGTGFTSEVFTQSIDNLTGKFTVNSSIAGSPFGLITPGPHTLARVRLRAKADVLTDDRRFVHSSLAIVKSSSSLLDVQGQTPASWTARTFRLRFGQLGDLATSASGADSVLPNLSVKPDGKIDFADQMIFTAGWNGVNGVRDRIADLGPVEGSPPEFISSPDGEWNLDDILAFTTMYSWAAANGAGRAATAEAPTAAAARWVSAEAARDAEAGRSAASGVSDGPNAVELVVSDRSARAGDRVSCDFVVRGATGLTGARFVVRSRSGRLQPIAVEERGFLRGREGAIAVRTTGEGWAQAAVSRLDRWDPTSRGDGVVASVVFEVRDGIEAGSGATGKLEAGLDPGRDLELEYDLRDRNGRVLAEGIWRADEASETAALDAPRFIGITPNPNAGFGTLSLRLGAPTVVRLELFDAAGRRLRELSELSLPSGTHHLPLDGSRSGGSPLPAGVYFLRMESGRTTETRRWVVIR